MTVILYHFIFASLTLSTLKKRRDLREETSSVRSRASRSHADATCHAIHSLFSFFHSGQGVLCLGSAVLRLALLTEGLLEEAELSLLLLDDLVQRVPVARSRVVAREMDRDV